MVPSLLRATGSVLQKQKKWSRLHPGNHIPSANNYGRGAKNKPFIMAVIGQLLFGFILYGRNADLIYYFKYVEGNENLFPFFSMVIILPSIAGAALFPMVFKLTNNKGWAASVFSLLTGVSMILLYYFSPNTSPVMFYTLAALAQFCKARGAKKVLITDISDLRLQKARECGIEYTANVAKIPLKEAVKETFGEEGYQAGFEVAGVESSIRSLMETIEKGSDIVIVAVFSKDPALSMFYLGEHELRLIGSMMYRHEDYETAVDFVNKGRVDLTPLVSNRFPFEKYDDAYRFIDDNRDTSMKLIIDLEEKTDA